MRYETLEDDYVSRFKIAAIEKCQVAVYFHRRFCNLFARQRRSGEFTNSAIPQV